MARLRFIAVAFVTLCAPTLLIGCNGSTAPPIKTLASGAPIIGEWIQYIVTALNKATSWALGHDTVSIEQEGETEAGKADFRITVSNGKTSFSFVLRDIPVGEDGTPMDSSYEKLDEAVDGLKDQIDRFQD